MTVTSRDDLSRHMARVAEALLGAPNQSLSKQGKEWRYGTHGSLAIDLQKGTYFDFETNKGGGVLHLIKREKGISGADAMDFMRQIDCDLPPRSGNGVATISSRKLVASFDYTDANGQLVFQVLRYEPKGFLQRRPDGNGGWQFRRGAPLPYRLPDLIEAIALGRTVFVVEGEGKVDALANWNVPATSSAEGAKKWKPEHSEYLRGADVVILPDNDNPGRDHANVVGTSLQGIASRVRVLELPGLGPKGDIVNWIELEARQRISGSLWTRRLGSGRRPTIRSPPSIQVGPGAQSAPVTYSKSTLIQFATSCPDTFQRALRS